MVITKSEPFTKEEIIIKNNLILSSLAMDLRRAAIGLNKCGGFKEVCKKYAG